MNRVIPLLAFSILLLVPVSQNAFAGSVAPTCPAGTMLNIVSDLCEGPTTSLPTCPLGGTYHNSQNMCGNTLAVIGFVTTGPATCPAGTEINFVLDLCVPTASVPPTCPLGGTYHNSQDMCGNTLAFIGFVTTGPATCPAGTEINFVLDVCLGTPSVPPTCPAGTNYDRGSNQCESSAAPPAPQVIGGEIIPIQSTSLILAGAQSFSWMLPVVLSGIGIGLFVVSRKSENS